MTAGVEQLASHSVVLASANSGKLREFGELLAGLNMKVVPQAEYAIEPAAETGLTFVENALLKARHASRLSGLPALADDSGIAVDALGGAPGIRSARYAGDDASDQANLDKLIAAIRPLPEESRTARYHCVIVYLRRADDPVPLIASGIWAGRLIETPRGHNGFGYDPIFYLDTHRCTAAELAPAEKNRLSHRGQALYRLLQQLEHERV